MPNQENWVSSSYRWVRRQVVSTARRQNAERSWMDGQSNVRGLASQPLEVHQPIKAVGWSAVWWWGPAHYHLSARRTTVSVSWWSDGRGLRHISVVINQRRRRNGSTKCYVDITWTFYTFPIHFILTKVSLESRHKRDLFFRKERNAETSELPSVHLPMAKQDPLPDCSIWMVTPSRVATDEYVWIASDFLSVLNVSKVKNRNDIA